MKTTLKGPARLTPRVMELPKQSFVSQSDAALPVVHVRIAVTTFRDVLTVTQGSAKSDFDMTVLTRHENVTQKNDTLLVKNGGAILHFNIEHKGEAQLYRPVGITFTRVEPGAVAAVYWSSGNQMGEPTPFSNLQLNGSTLQITDTLSPADYGRKKWARYKFSILIQKHTAGGGGAQVGAIGVLDPYFENDNEC